MNFRPFTRFWLQVAWASFGTILLPSLAHAASDVTVSTAATSGGSFSAANPAVFTPTAAAAVAGSADIVVKLNAGTGVTLITASAAVGNGNLTVSSAIAKTTGANATLTLNATRDLTVNATISSTVGPLPMTLNAGGNISITQAITSNDGNIVLAPAAGKTLTLAADVNAGTGQVLLQTGVVESSAAVTVTASGVQVSSNATWKQRGTVTGNLSVSGTLAAGPAAGNLQVNGALALLSNSTTLVDLGGTDQGWTYDSITATGPVTIAGTLQLNFLNGFENTIVNGNAFTILTGASITGTFTGLPDGSRVTLPNDLGSVKITYTATTVVLSDWQPVITELAWDPGTSDSGTQVFSNSNTRAGRHYFHISAQATDIGAWKTRLTVATGEADIYMYPTTVPQTTAYYYFKSERAGSDGIMLRSDQYSAAQDWYILVNVSAAGAQWSLFTGRAWVQDLGTLGWTDSNSNGAYDIGEASLPSGSGPVAVPVEGIRFFTTSIPTGTPAWSLWLNGDARDIAVRKASVPFHDSTSYYDRKQSGQMLVVAPYLNGLTSYFVSVTGNPGDPRFADPGSHRHRLQLDAIQRRRLRRTLPCLSRSGTGRTDRVGCRRHPDER